jgi:deazaflavin-dependent oxidoreductase (nitroreductase family)
MSSPTTRPPKLPPPWFIHTAWRVHRALYRLSGGRFLWTTSSKRGWGALRLTTTGRKSGVERNVIIGYIEDGPRLVTLAMNGWDEGHPAWWLNLEAHPDAVVRLAGQGPRPVHARAATGEEHDRLWAALGRDRCRSRRLRPAALDGDAGGCPRTAGRLCLRARPAPLSCSDDADEHVAGRGVEPRGSSSPVLAAERRCLRKSGKPSTPSCHVHDPAEAADTHGAFDSDCAGESPLWGRFRPTE